MNAAVYSLDARTPCRGEGAYQRTHTCVFAGTKRLAAEAKAIVSFSWYQHYKHEYLKYRKYFMKEDPIEVSLYKQTIVNSAW